MGVAVACVMMAHMPKRNNATQDETLGLVSVILDIPTWQQFRTLARDEGDSASKRLRRYIAGQVRRAQTDGRLDVQLLVEGDE